MTDAREYRKLVTSLPRVEIDRLIKIHNPRSRPERRSSLPESRTSLALIATINPAIAAEIERLTK
jgi:hypothetical protein